MTKNRKVIYEIVERSCVHPSAEEIFEEVKKIYPNVVRATVYNNLNALVDEGLIRKISCDGADRYDNARMPHEHLICQCCGELSDFQMEDLTEAINEKTGTKISSYSLIVRYTCDKCIEAGKIQ